MTSTQIGAQRHRDGDGYGYGDETKMQRDSESAKGSASMRAAVRFGLLTTSRHVGWVCCSAGP